MHHLIDESSVESDGGHLNFMCVRIRINTAPLLVSLLGIFICTLFAAFYALNGEYVMLFPLIALYIDHFLILLGNRLRVPKFYALFIYSAKFFITMLVTGMLFYMYIIIGDSQRLHGYESIWMTFQHERVRILVAFSFLIFGLAHRWFLIVIKTDYEFMRYQRLLQRTATIYSLMSEIQSRDEREKQPPYLSTVVVIKPLLEDI